MMDVVSMRYRLAIYALFGVLLISDLFGVYSSVKASDKSTSNRVTQSATHQHHPMANSMRNSDHITAQTVSGGIKPVDDVLNKFQAEHPQLTSTADDSNGINDVSFKLSSTKLKIENIKESCLPKLLCEMASKPEYMLAEKERELLNMIRSSSMSLASYGLPKYWHFATHMGELLRHSYDGKSGPMGCAHLWPKCPISSKKLSRISNTMQL